MTTLEFHKNLSFLAKALQSFALRLTKNTDDAKKLYHETTIRISNNKDKHIDETNLKTWTFAIMNDIFINDYKKKASKTIYDTENKFFGDVTSHATTNQNSDPVMKELLDKVNSLDESIRLPFKMHHEGYNYNEIADHFDLPLDTIKNNIFIVRKALRDIIIRNGDYHSLRTMIA